MLSFSLNLLFDSWHSELQFHPVPAKELAPSTGFGSFKELSATTSTTKRGGREIERERLGETETERGERLRESETERDREGGAERERLRETETERGERHTERDRDRYRDRDRDTQRDRDRDTQRYRETETERQKEREGEGGSQKRSFGDVCSAREGMSRDVIANNQTGDTALRTS